MRFRYLLGCPADHGVYLRSLALFKRQGTPESKNHKLLVDFRWTLSIQLFHQGTTLSTLSNRVASN